MNEIAIGILDLAVLLILFLTGIELGFAMAIMGFIGFAFLVSLPAAFNLLAKDIFDTFSSYGFTVIPLFIFMGQIAFNAGIAKQLFDSSHKFMGHIPGGLAIATVAGATVFKAICGSSPATAATFASVAVPEMDRFGYSRKLSTGIVATVGTLGILIPPSVTLIVFGVITEQSIGKLFMAGLIPGLLIALFFVFIIVGWVKMNPAIAPRSPKFPWGDRLRSLPPVIWPVLIFLVVIGGLLNGFFTPTEAGSIGTAAVLVVAFSQRALGWKAFAKAVDEALRTACMVIMLIAGSAILGHFIAVTNIPSLAGGLDRIAAASQVRDHDHHRLLLPPRWLLHRRPCLHDPGNPHLLSGHHQAGLRPHVVRHHDRHHGHGRGRHPPCCHQCLRREEYYENTVQRDLRRGLPIPLIPGLLWSPALHIPVPRNVAARNAVWEIERSRTRTACVDKEGGHHRGQLTKRETSYAKLLRASLTHLPQLQILE